jgi:hypothetical protein
LPVGCKDKELIPNLLQVIDFFKIPFLRPYLCNMDNRKRPLNNVIIFTMQQKINAIICLILLLSIVIINGVKTYHIDIQHIIKIESIVILSYFIVISIVIHCFFIVIMQNLFYSKIK